MYIYTYIYIYVYIYLYIYIFIEGFFLSLSEWAGDIFTYGSTIICVCVYVYIRIYTISYTLIVVNVSFFHRLMSFEVQSCINLKKKFY